MKLQLRIPICNLAYVHIPYTVTEQGVYWGECSQYYYLMWTSRYFIVGSTK